MNQPAAVSIRNLTVRYTRGGYEVTPVDQLSLEIEPGSLVLLLGPSGCGKTTLLSCLAGIQRPSSGAVVVAGAEITSMNDAEMTKYRRHGVGVVFQAFNLIPSLDAVDNVAVSIRSSGVSWREARRRAVGLLTEVGLADRLDHRPADLSGGQQQRVAIARALALEPRLVLADEPTANLDHRQVETVLRLLRGLTSRGHTVVVSTHDHRLLALADRVVDLAVGTDQGSAKPGRNLHIAAGDVLFREGDSGDEIYEVTSGRIELRRGDGPDGGKVVATLGVGACFGEMGALFHLPRSATALALDDTALVVRNPGEFRAAHGPARLLELVGQTLAAVD